MRKLIKKSTEWGHATLIIAIIIPLLHALCAEQPDTIGQYLYFKCLVIIFPIVMSDLAIEKCKGLFSYLLACVLIFAATGGLSWIIAGSLQAGVLLWGYMILILIETIFVLLNRLAERLHKKKEADAMLGENPDWHPSYALLREPSFFILIYFAVVYIIALNLNDPAACNAALFSAVIYTLLTFLYQYICETEKYLFLNKRTCNLPSRRIYGIGSGMLAIFLLLLMIVTLPSLFTISHRHYRDLREWASNIEFNYTEPLPENDMEYIGEDPMEALFAEYGEIKPTPQWVTALTYMIEITVFAVLAFMLLKKIYATFRDFRKAVDENGDIIEELKDAEEAVSPVQKTTPVRRRKLSERERIRKEYRKTIKRHRKDRPAPYESPREIEMNAGITDNEELHQNYERARYGKETQ